MEPEKLKSEFGDKITFWGGGVDTQHVLPEGPLDEIKQQVIERIRIFAPGGGFVFTPVHNIQAPVSPEAVVMVYDTVIQNRNYPIR